MPVPEFQVMSDIDTSKIDPVIHKIFLLSMDDAVVSQISETMSAKISDLLCDYYPDICERIYHELSVTQNQKFIHILYSIYLISQIDDHSLLDQFAGLRSSVHSIRFYENPNEWRWKAGKHNVYINLPKIKTNKILREVMTHEIAGHMYDLWVMQDTESPPDKNFTEFGQGNFGIQDPSLEYYRISRASEQKKLSGQWSSEFTTIYSQVNAFEDIAEVINLWINHNAALKKLWELDPAIQQRVDFMQNIFGDRYVFEDIQASEELQDDLRFCDSTTTNQNIISIQNLNNLDEAYVRCRFE